MQKNRFIAIMMFQVLKKMLFLLSNPCVALVGVSSFKPSFHKYSCLCSVSCLPSHTGSELCPAPPPSLLPLILTITNICNTRRPFDSDHKYVCYLLNKVLVCDKRQQREPMTPADLLLAPHTVGYEKQSFLLSLLFFSFWLSSLTKDMKETLLRCIVGPIM